MHLEVVDCPTQLIFTWIFKAKRTKLGNLLIWKRPLISGLRAPKLKRFSIWKFKGSLRALKNKKVLNTWIGPVESESANEFKIETKGKVGKECCLPKRQLLGRVSKVWKGRQAGGTTCTIPHNTMWWHCCHNCATWLCWELAAAAKRSPPALKWEWRENRSHRRKRDPDS